MAPKIYNYSQTQLFQTKEHKYQILSDINNKKAEKALSDIIMLSPRWSTNFGRSISVNSSHLPLSEKCLKVTTPVNCTPKTSKQN